MKNLQLQILTWGISFLFMIHPEGAVSQGMPVYDNTNFLSLAKQLIESAKQTSHLLKTVDFLSKQKENIEKVNRVVQQLQAVQELTRNHQRLYNTIRTDVRQLLSSPYIHYDEAQQISDSFDAMIELSLSDLDFIDQVLSSDLLRMSDSERTMMLQQKEQRSRELLLGVRVQLQRYRDIAAFREVQDLLNARTVSF